MSAECIIILAAFSFSVVHKYIFFITQRFLDTSSFLTKYFFYENLIF